MSIGECTPVELPVVADRQGNLAFAEADSHVPFPIARVFYVYDVPAEARRGGHAHLKLEQAIFCLAGSLEIIVDDGCDRQPYRLDDPCRGLYLPPMVWHDIGGFAAGTVYMVLASSVYAESDYIRDYDGFLSAAAATV